MPKRARYIVTIFALLAMITSVKAPQAASAAVDEYRVVALGDSYTSGNGALEYFHHDCYRSSNSYVYQYAELLESSREVHPDNYACHGHKTSNIPAQIQQAQSALDRADAVFLTIGGNDGDFKSIAVQCVSPLRLITNCHDDVNAARESLDRIVTDTRQAILQVHQAAPEADVVLVGYPFLLASGCNADSNIVRSLQSAADSHMMVMVLELQKSHGDWVHYAQMTTAFAGGEVCGDDGQLIRGAFDTLDVNEWYHPNVEGHRRVAEVLVGMNLHEVNSPPSSPTPSSPPNPTPPPQTDAQHYPDLPFECGVETVYASTYEQLHLHGSTINHGYALDFPIQEGTPVSSPESGVVSVDLNAGGYGKLVVLEGDSGVTHYFAHLEHTVVNPNQRVSRGQILGLVGQTGMATGPHLHYEQRVSGASREIQLGGPTLVWGPSQGASGFRTTTHKLVSANCAPPPGQADVIALADEGLVWHRGNGVSRDGWRIIKDDMFIPEWSDSCDMDRDGYDEYIVLDTEKSRIMMADSGPNANGSFNWRRMADANNGHSIVCGDWNSDGLDDLVMHTTTGAILVNISSGSGFPRWYKVHQHGGSPPKYWDMCDLNGDGRDEVVSYHADTNRFIVGRNIDGLMKRDVIFTNAPGTKGIACGNFLPDVADEIVMWDWGRGGRYFLLEYDYHFVRTRSQGLQPTGFLEPHNGEMTAADIDGDGLDEFVVNEYRPDSNNHAIMVGDFSSDTTFVWHTFHHRTQAAFIAVGEFVK